MVYKLYKHKDPTKHVVSGITVFLGLGTKVQDPYVSVVFSGLMLRRVGLLKKGHGIRRSDFIMANVEDLTQDPHAFGLPEKLAVAHGQALLVAPA